MKTCINALIQSKTRVQPPLKSMHTNSCLFLNVNMFFNKRVLLKNIWLYCFHHCQFICSITSSYGGECVQRESVWTNKKNFLKVVEAANFHCLCFGMIILVEFVLVRWSLTGLRQMQLRFFNELIRSFLTFQHFIFCWLLFLCIL